MGRFFLLRLVALFLMLLAVLVLSFTVYLYLVIDLNAEHLIRVIGVDESWRSVSTLVAARELITGVVLSLTLFAASLFLLLMISIESNTYNTNRLLERMLSQNTGRRQRMDFAPDAPNWNDLPVPIPSGEIDRHLGKKRRNVP